MKDGRIAYRLKTPRRGKTHRVMTPVEFLARLAILVPPPYFPLVRYHSERSERVFAARSSWRALVTRCPKCTARMRVMATITEPDAVKKILAHLNLPTEPLPRARARDPTEQQSFDFDAA